MATTRHLTQHIRSGKTIMETLKDGFDYGQNPDKTRNGDLVTAYECDPRTADAEFLLSKAKYKAITGREQKREKDVLYYHQRQAFPPGEVDAETALAISYETALRWTKGNHAFFVVSHIDRPHPHCHIYYNSTTLDCTRKFRDFLGSAMAFRRLSDRVCLEKGLSIVEHPKQKSKGKFKHYGQWQDAHGGKVPTFKERLKAQIDACLAQGPGGFDDFLSMMAAAGFEHKQGRGGALSFRNPAHGQERFTRLRASTLGEGYTPERIRAAIGGQGTLPGRAGLPRQRTAARLDLVIDIQKRMRDKGPGYARWAKVFNLKQMAAALQYLQENGIADYGQLAEKAAAATDRFHTLEWQVKGIDTELETNAAIRAAVVDYAKTRPVFDGYKAARYSKKYLAGHEADIALHRAARATFSRLLTGGAKLPEMDALKKEQGRLVAEKKAALREYRQAREEMREAMTAKANIDHLFEITGPAKNKEMER